jgi:hypothetical protein
LVSLTILVVAPAGGAWTAALKRVALASMYAFHPYRHVETTLWTLYHRLHHPLRPPPLRGGSW